MMFEIEMEGFEFFEMLFLVIVSLIVGMYCFEFIFFLEFFLIIIEGFIECLVIL